MKSHRVSNQTSGIHRRLNYQPLANKHDHSGVGSTFWKVRERPQYQCKVFDQDDGTPIFSGGDDRLEQRSSAPCDQKIKEDKWGRWDLYLYHQLDFPVPNR